MDLNVHCVDAFLNIVPGQKLLALRKCLSPLLDKSVGVSKEKQFSIVPADLQSIQILFEKLSASASSFYSI